MRAGTTEGYHALLLILGAFACDGTLIDFKIDGSGIAAVIVHEQIAIFDDRAYTFSVEEFVRVIVDGGSNGIDPVLELLVGECGVFAAALGGSSLSIQIGRYDTFHLFYILGVFSSRQGAG